MFNKSVVFAIALLGLGSYSNANSLSIPLTKKVTLVIEQGDITKKKVDAIVNAANQDLMGGAGVCGAIFQAAGHNELQSACNQWKSCPTGQARITPSFKLSKIGISHIIHAVGPDCRLIESTKEQDKLLYNTYYNSLKLADEHKISTIAFPFISSGIYAFPRERAAQIAIDAIKDYTQEKGLTTNLSKIYMVLFSNKDATLFIDTAKSLQAPIKGKK